jgi:hypothetical protein
MKYITGDFEALNIVSDYRLKTPIHNGTPSYVEMLMTYNIKILSVTSDVFYITYNSNINNYIECSSTVRQNLHQTCAVAGAKLGTE